MFHVPAHKVPANDPNQPGQINNRVRLVVADDFEAFEPSEMDAPSLFDAAREALEAA